MKQNKRWQKAFLVMGLMLILAVGYGVSHRKTNTHQILRQKGGNQRYHVTWDGEEFDMTISYRKKGKKQKEFILPQHKPTKQEELQAYVKEIEKNTRKNESFALPDSYQGKPVYWESKPDYTPVLFVIAGLILAVLCYKEPDWEEKKQRKRRQQQINLSYPRLVGVLTTFLESGMSLRYAILRMAEERLGGDGPLQEELTKAAGRLTRGEGLPQTLQEFAKGCDTRPYRKFAALLQQNLEKGNSGLQQMLELEVQESEAMRLSAAKLAGERAQTKILLPLTMLLGLVVVILMAPAFLQMKQM
ncbi:Type II secretion system (T2SS), protein F [Lachnospiraceae bacterium XBB1006]|nr:Type II secretion system (T2SS), protein F [Lachnospiraceae bacterium XBB1006]